MKLLRNISVAHKIGFGFLILVIICLIVVVLGRLSVNLASDRLAVYRAVGDYQKIINRLDVDVAELQRKLLIYRFAHTTTSIDDLKHAVENLHYDVETLASNREFLPSIQARYVPKLSESLVKIAETFDNLELQRALREELRLQLQREFDQAYAVMVEAQNSSDHQIFKQWLMESQVYLASANVNAVNYFSSKEHSLLKNTQEYLTLAESVLVNDLSGATSVDEINHQQIASVIQVVQKTFHSALQVDRSFVFLVNVMITGETAELKGLITKTIHDAESYLALAADKNDLSMLQTKRLTLYGSLVLLLFAAVLAVVVILDLVKPIRGITATFGRLGRGESVSEIKELRRNDELGELARAADVFRQTSLKTKALLREAETLARDLKVRESQLQKSNGELDRFAYVASHDLKSPLRAIKNLADWIEEDCGDILPAESKQHFHLLKTRIDRMEKLLVDVLNYSRVGRLDAEILEFNLQDAMGEALALVEIPDNMSFCVPDSLQVIRARKAPLVQIFQNLFSNAIKYNDKKRGKIRVRVQEQNDQYLKVSVSDNGIGIEQQYWDRVFLMFHTLHSRDEIESSGMGLAIVKKTLESEGGSIWIEPRSCVGITFVFTWPKTII